MANIRIDVDHTIHDGMDIIFRTPCDCSAVTGIKVYYPQSNSTTASKVFTLKDAHNNDIGDISDLFASGVLIKVLLDVTNGYAYIQNADTNTYLESRLDLFVEDTDHPGCYYRDIRYMDNGIPVFSREWVNPPMDYNGGTMSKSYRTTERWGGKPVYIYIAKYGSASITAESLIASERVGEIDELIGYRFITTYNDGSIIELPCVDNNENTYGYVKKDIVDKEIVMNIRNIDIDNISHIFCVAKYTLV